MAWWMALVLVQTVAAAPPPAPILLEPDRVFDGIDPTPHAGWQVLVQGERIVAVGRI